MDSSQDTISQILGGFASSEKVNLSLGVWQLPRSYILILHGHETVSCQQAVWDSFVFTKED